MSAPASVGDFLSLVKKSGVLDLNRFSEEFPNPEDLPNDPVECANALIKANLLTQFQARQLLSGKFRGLVLGVYKVLRPIGQGGMGVVCLAEHMTLHRRVALKILPAQHAGDRLALERFMREARSTAALDHPNIVRLHDVCQDGGSHFLVMELVDGKNLHALLSETGPLHFATAVSYIAQAAEGLQHAHSKGFVHRDIKPANLMVSKDGVVKILDMGLARSFVSESDNLTGTIGEGEGSLGTLDYVSPEQALGHPVDELADIYSLGATLYYLIAGHPPYKGTRAQILLKHQMSAPPRLSKSLKVPVPDALNDVIAKMMAKKKSDRYQSAEEVIDALSPWLPASPSTGNLQASINTQDLRASGAPTVRTRPHKRKGRKKRQEVGNPNAKWYILGGSLVLAAALTGIALAVFGGSDKKPVAADSAPPPPTTPASIPTPSTPVASNIDSQLILTSTAQVNDVVISRDGSRFAAVDWAGGLIYGNTANLQKLNTVTVQAKANINCCAISPDNHYLVAGGRQTPIAIYDWATGAKVRQFDGHIDTTWAVAVSPSGKTLLSCGNDNAVLLRDFGTGEQIRRFTFETKQVWTAVFSPDGTKIAAGCATSTNAEEANQIRIWDVATGRELQRLKRHTKDVRWVTFSPDGQTLASGSFDGTIRQWEVATGKPINSITAHKATTYGVERVFYIKGGKQIVSCGSLTTNTAAGSALRVWDAATGKEIRTWAGAEAKGTIALAISPDGNYALTGNREKTVRLWKLDF
jgi:serine/threonine protein kinase